MSLLSIVVMLLGFGFVIFWHELGHFLGARRAGIRVEQFAVGMGPAVLSYRKGIGVRLGSTARAFHDRVKAEVARRGMDREPTLREAYQIADEIGLGETEYRLSLLPIGGYVKPTGQDDLRPAPEAWIDDPKSYAAATVGKRMVLISAGVIMNVILAGILFFVLFRFIGFEAMQAKVGDVQSNSPAAQAGLRSGDELLELDGATLHDFTKVLMNVALLPDDETVDLKIRRDGEERTVGIRARPTIANNYMLAFGITGPHTLAARSPDDVDEKQFATLPAASQIVRPGERIIAVNGKMVAVEDHAALDRAVQTGRPVTISVADVGGATRDATFVPSFTANFNNAPFQIVGLSPRTRIGEIQDNSSAKGHLAVGDVVLSIARGTEKPIAFPSARTFSDTTRAAGRAGEPLTFRVLRDGKAVDVPDVTPTTKLPDGARGLGVAPAGDFDQLVIGEVDGGTSAGGAGIVGGSTITAIDGVPVTTWHELHRAVIAQNAQSPTAVRVAVLDPAGNLRDITLTPTRDEIANAASLRYASPMPADLFTELTKIRKTDSALTALGWGVAETRDLILQGYLTLKRVVYNRTVPASNMSGPVGIFRAGTTLFSERGTPWFIWFLAVISANLAVVNFLPIPILDGWHFLSLVKEKLTGTPVPDRVQEVAQYIGLALILSLVVFVTYNDIMRL